MFCADDTTLSVFGKFLGDTLEVASSLKKRIKYWFTANMLSVNHDKTKLMVLSKRHHEPLDTECNSLAFLGVEIDRSLNWNAHCEEVAGK